MSFNRTFSHEIPSRPRLFQMPVFKPGTRVMQGGREETVSHVVLRRREMMVYLVGREDPVRPDRLSLEPQWFTTERNPQALQWYL
ncbi:MAG: hypothetical protein KBF33_13265 [Comamonas sp.]|nr:hypothetical protein [Comamonas sp.]